MLSHWFAWLYTHNFMSYLQSLAVFLSFDLHFAKLWVDMWPKLKNHQSLTLLKSLFVLVRLCWGWRVDMLLGSSQIKVSYSYYLFDNCFGVDNYAMHEGVLEPLTNFCLNIYFTFSLIILSLIFLSKFCFALKGYARRL